MVKQTKKNIILNLYYKTNITNIELYENRFLNEKKTTPLKFLNIICKKLNKYILNKQLKLSIYNFRNFYKTNTICKKLNKYILNNQLKLSIYNFKNSYKNKNFDGILYNNNKVKYIGSYILDNNTYIYEGEGILFDDNDNVVYEGSFKNNKYNGYGKYYENEILKYEGNFYNNMFHGDGKYYYEKGIVYKGTFLNNIKTNIGQLLNKNNKIFLSGYWKNDKYIGISDYLNNYDIHCDDFIEKNKILKNRIENTFCLIKNNTCINKCITNIEIDIDNIINSYNNIEILENINITSAKDIEIIVEKVCSLLYGFDIFNTAGDGNGCGIFDKDYILKILEIEDLDSNKLTTSCTNTMGLTQFNFKCKCHSNISIFDSGNCVNKIKISNKIKDTRHFAMVLSHEIMHIFIHNYQRFYRKNITYNEGKVDLLLSKRQEEGLCELVSFIVGLYYDSSYDIVYSISKYTNTMFYNIFYKKNTDILNIDKENLINNYYYGLQDCIEILKEKKTLVETFKHILNYKNINTNIINYKEYVTWNTYNLVYYTNFINIFSSCVINIKLYNIEYLEIIKYMLERLLTQIKKNKNKNIYNLPLDSILNKKYKLETILKNTYCNKLLHILNYSIIDNILVCNINKNMSYNDIITFYEIIIKVFNNIY